MFNVMKPAASR